eukprot:CAMPEP_0117076288 /NCGR_PEP_ID=MMETSP0472-20121206/53778_1 /TAXON_ID=693140 ORGANISM="Tiarina fusus, Strain LIS" /NCGR_SAMPLE_ID=MMETSP0472 /ASSEMBLY_ACC=CAM_ASM_000603 /LENGTH=441 /DNA_ID=CAMNT_0004802127 /DNA_START=20 /DNA_END=1342 /DNA_ORIENTATION=+
MTFDDIDTRHDAGNAACSEIESISLQSRLARIDSQVHEVAWSDVQEEATIGIGGFSRVYKIRVNLPQLSSSKSFALKCLNTKTMEREKRFIVGAKDLATEGEILSRLHHENIIQIHGVSSGGPKDAFVNSERGYFLILDLLEKDTLSNKLETFRRKNSKKHSSVRRALRGGAKAASPDDIASCATERIKTVGIGVAKGLEYLHTMGVVLRDLKPDNVGFDSNGTPKIFDLGFAREVHTLNPLEIAGSLRYMAPEVACGHGSSLASDVYSFGVLLWELCTLDKPFKEISGTKEDFIANLVGGHFRPSLTSIRSPAMRRLISECWDSNPDARPTMGRVVKALRLATLDLPGQQQHPTAGAGLVANSSSNNVHPGGMTVVNNSFGISTSKLGGRSSSLSRMNSWHARKMSESSLGFFKSLSRGSSIGKSSSPATPPQANATFSL